MPHDVRRLPFGLFNVEEDTLAGPAVSLPPALSRATGADADCLIGAAAGGDNGCSASCKSQWVSGQKQVSVVIPQGIEVHV